MKTPEHMIEETEDWRFTYWSDGILDIRDKNDDCIGGVILETDDANVLLKFMNRVKAIINFASGLELEPTDLMRQIRGSAPKTNEVVKK